MITIVGSFRTLQNIWQTFYIRVLSLYLINYASQYDDVWGGKYEGVSILSGTGADHLYISCSTATQQ
jgi:hypothetical protein